MYIRLCFFLLMIGCLTPLSSLALTASSSGSGTNTYMFIENDVDQEYFITSGSLSPRFVGANVWTKYKTRQRSLGYIGYTGWAYSNRYFDFWIENSPINKPFLGIRCMTTGANCPSSGYIQPDKIDELGFYHAKSGNSVANGYYGAGTLSPSAYQYFKDLPVGTSETYNLNLCYMDLNTDYDYTSGKRCKDLESGGTWRYYSITLNKVGHLNLRGTGALAEIWLASDGTPSVNIGSDMCQVGVVSGVSGLICKMVSYSLQQTQVLNNSLDFQMLIDTAKLGFTPSASDIKYSGDTSTWYNYSYATNYNKIFSVGGDYVYVFLSNVFFKKALSAGVNIGHSDSLFTFYFNNSVTPQSGYYQFTPSTHLNILPKEYGISIVSKDGSANPSASGKLGDDIPIMLEYRVTTSASRQADSITAQVVGNSTNINGVPYCLFLSSDNSLSVPVPAYLSWQSKSGKEIKVRNSCNEAPVDMTDAAWVQTTWNANVDDGFYFSTILKLIFPMNNSRSLFTTDGDDWMGTVSASGEIKVTATWVGVDR